MNSNVSSSASFSNLFPTLTESAEPLPAAMVPALALESELHSHIDETTARKLASLTDQMVGTEKAEEQTVLANQILALRETGLACLFLARNTLPPRQAADLYTRAAAILQYERRNEQRFHSEQSSTGIVFPPPVSDEEFSQYMEECADFCWEHDFKAAAVKILSEGFDAGQDYVMDLLWPAVTKAIQIDADDLADELLTGGACETQMWYGLRGLLLFRRAGDSPAARGALASGRVPAILLSSEVDDDSNAGEKTESLVSTQDAWEYTPGSMAWAKKTLTQLFARSSVQVAKEDFELMKRVKRWDDCFDLALRFAKKNDLKEAKRLIRAAFRSAEKLGSQTSAYRRTFSKYVEILDELGASKSDLIKVVQQDYLEVWSKPCSKDTLAFALGKVGERFVEVNRYKEGLKALTESTDIFADMLEAGNDAFNLRDYADAHFNLGICWGELRHYEEASRHFCLCIKLDVEYLGPDHPHLIQPIDRLWRCLHHMGEHAEEATVKDRMKEIEPDSIVDAHTSHGPGCPWYVPRCQTAKPIQWEQFLRTRVLK